MPVWTWILLALQRFAQFSLNPLLRSEIAIVDRNDRYLSLHISSTPVGLVLGDWSTHNSDGSSYYECKKYASAQAAGRAPFRKFSILSLLGNYWFCLVCADFPDIVVYKHFFSQLATHRPALSFSLGIALNKEEESFAANQAFLQVRPVTPLGVLSNLFLAFSRCFIPSHSGVLI